MSEVVSSVVAPLITEGPRGFTDVRFCGAGATSRVFRAQETASGRTVALKRLHKQLVRDPKALARLKRELEALRRLRHDVIVQVSDVITWNGDPTLVMDFIEGEDLKERIKRLGQLSAEETTSIARALFDALSLAHGSGIVHRDVKPQNVRVTPAGQVYLLDFGSARLDASSQLTATGTTVGTPEYMAPELFAGPVYDPRVDVYGVGATLYECLTGHPPHIADSLAELARMRTTVDALPVLASAGMHSDVSPALAAVVDRCLARAPEDRFPSASLAAWALDHPEAERALAARRALSPLCLKCTTAIPRESATCPACGARQPFRYAPGPCHVDIRSVENVTRFLEHVAIRFPERATPEELELLAERCAALSFAPQRYVSFVSDRDAEHIANELGASGARATVVREPSWWVNLFAGLAFPPYLPVRVPLGLLRGLGSMLSTSSVPRPVMPRVTEVAAFATMLSFIALFFFALSDVPMKDMYPWLSALGAILITSGVALMASLTIGLRKPTLGPGAAAQPAVVLGELIAASPPEQQGEKRRGAAPPWMLVATVLPLIVEIFGLALVQSAMRSIPEPTRPPPRSAAAPWVKVDSPSGYVSVPGATPQATLQPIAEEATDDAREVGLALGSGALIAGILAAMVARRRRLRRDTAAIMAGLDLPAFARLGERSSPHRTEAHGGDVDTLANMRTKDVFAARAIQRAAELMPLLAKAQASRLATSIEALVRGSDGLVASERSLVSRSILEADPQQRLRFELLALEGQLEAQAAAEWLERRARIASDPADEAEITDAEMIVVEEVPAAAQKRMMERPK